MSIVIVEGAFVCVTVRVERVEEDVLATEEVSMMTVDGGNVSTITETVWGAEEVEDVNWNWAVPDPVILRPISSAKAMESKKRNNMLTAISHWSDRRKGIWGPIYDNPAKKEVWKGWREAQVSMAKAFTAPHKHSRSTSSET
jgi:hypothetical protein